MSELSQRIANLSPEKRQLLLQRLNQKQENPFSRMAIKPQSRESNSLPLSFAQQRLWFLSQLEPDSPFYNIQIGVRLHGQLNQGALEQTFNEILRRHQALRMNIQTVAGQPVAVISPVTPLQLPLIDISELPNNQKEAEVRQLTLAEAQQPFDLNSDLLLRVKLLRLGKQEHILLATMHHIVSDGWSIGILVREVATLYEAFCAGQPSPLPELSIQYPDFAAWQRQWLQAEVLPAQMSYWRKQLEGAPPVLELPADQPRPAIQTFRGASYGFQLSPELSLALNQLSQATGSTLFITLLTAFKILLGRYTGSEDMVVGTPIANRNQAEIEGLIGFFVNTLVLRTDLSGNPSFRELLGRVQQVALGAYAHQDLPFEQLVEELQPQRSLSHTPLFQVMFVLQNAPMAEIELPGLTLSPLASDSGTAKFDLTLNLEQTAEGLAGTLEYNTDLFEAATITRMVGHFQTLLAAIVANPQQRLWELSVLTEAEQHQLLVEWNDTQADYPQQACIHKLFEAQVEKTPDAVAVVFEDQQLTYRELNARANSIAHHLQKLGVKPEVLVGICVERSLDMVIGLLGILKAGGAYVPLDPAYPQERLAFMLADAQVSVLLTQQQLLKDLPEHQTRIVCLDRDWRSIAQESQENPLSGCTADNAAYLIYTSGSTGQPKGVLVNHQNVTRLLAATQSWFNFNSQDVWTLFHSIAFDFSVWEIWGALLFGGRLVVVSYSVSRSPESFYELLCQQQVSVLNQTPSAFRQLIQAEASLGTAKQLALRLVIFGGEALELQSLKPWFDLHGDNYPQLVNMYGITETTVHVTYRPLTMADVKVATGSVIGRPIPDLQVYLLDQHQQLVPVGVWGEMYIGGAGLARGYLNHPELTTQKFIAHPYSHKPNARLYKSGDLARYLPNGDIEYLGRIDNQVKVRGFRIELPEIEAFLSQHSAVQENVVVVREDVPGDKHLVAYVVWDRELAPSVSELRRFLKQKLPEYMVPAVFVPLAALPLTPNGKVDRKALPAPDKARPELDKAFLAPRTPVEIKLAEIWAKVLGVEQVGIHDNFFELGGDSILTIQIVARANQAGLQLTPKQLFEHQNIAELAAVAITKKALPAEQGIVTGAVFLTPIQKWFFEQNLSAPHHFNQAVLLEVQQHIDLTLLEQAIGYLVLHHDALRLRFEQTEFGWQQVQANTETLVPFRRFDFSALAKTEQHSAIEVTATELQASLNFSEPLVRVGFFDLGVSQPSRLLLVIHHLLVDGVSWRILLEDLQTAYQQLNRGEQVQLPAKTTSFQQWSQKLQKYARSTALQQELDYWCRQSRKPSIPLPVDFPGGENTMASLGCVSSTLSFQETQALLKEVPQTYSTQINDVLLTALLQAFAQSTGERTLLVELEGHGREEIFADVDLSRTVGWFTTVFPVLLNLGEASNPGDALKKVKEQLRGIPNRGIGYGVLRYLSEDQGIIEQLSTLPQAEVIFNYLGQFDQTLSESSWLRLAQESSGQERSLQGKRRHLLEINGLVSGGQLQLNWSYSQKVHQRATIEALAQRFLEAMRSLIAHCQSPEAGGFTPSDFPLAQLGQDELDAALGMVEFDGGAR